MRNVNVIYDATEFLNIIIEQKQLTRDTNISASVCNMILSITQLIMKHLGFILRSDTAVSQRKLY